MSNGGREGINPHGGSTHLKAYRAFALYADSNFSTDLITNAFRHVSFLRAIHSNGLSLTRPTLNSMRRYVDLWLPIVAANPREPLVPPADVAWLWHCHRLAPLRYAAYTRRRFGEVVEATRPFSMQLSVGPTGSAAASIWETMHPDEPFFAQDEQREDAGDESSAVLDGFNVLESCERQATFLWQVSQPNFSDIRFLGEGQTNYYKFLCLKGSARKEQIVVPTYQIDLLWHTHILTSITDYNTDCRGILGSLLNHDDSLNDRAEDSDLNRAFKQTCELWGAAYGCGYHVSGGMYRGEPPQDYFNADWVSSLPEVPQDAIEGWFDLLLDGDGLTSSSAPSAGMGAGNGSQADALSASPACFGSLCQVPVFTSAPSAGTGGGNGSPTDGDSMKAQVPDYSAGAPPPPPPPEVELDTMPPPSYEELDFKSVEEPGAFLHANPKATSKGENANPARAGYVFGKGPKGGGYYHLETREAAEIIYSRVSNKHAKARKCECCCSVLMCGLPLCVPGLLTGAKKLEEQKKKAEEWKDGKNRPSKEAAARRDQQSGGGCGAACAYWGGGFLFVAAACGAQTASSCGGAGCGAAACGGAGCGAAGCGAASCGGGSCGGGGGCGGGGCGG